MPVANQMQPAKRPHENTAQIIALVLLITFVASFAVLLAINIIFSAWPLSDDTNGDTKKSWFELMKTASVLLGTALTTVIGYYFGQRESAQIRREAQAAENKAETKEKEAENAKRVLDSVTADLPQGMSEDFDPTQI